MIICRAATFKQLHGFFYAWRSTSVIVLLMNVLHQA